MPKKILTVFSRPVDIVLICALLLGQIYVSKRLRVYYRMSDQQRLESEARQRAVLEINERDREGLKSGEPDRAPRESKTGE